MMKIHEKINPTRRLVMCIYMFLCGFGSAAELKNIGRFDQLFPNAYCVLYFDGDKSMVILERSIGELPIPSHNANFPKCLVVGSFDPKTNVWNKSTIIEKDGKFKIPVESKGKTIRYIVDVKALIKSARRNLIVRGVPVSPRAKP